jgi:hypothetical protein
VTATLLALPPDPRFSELIDSWPDAWQTLMWPRSKWLRSFEDLLADFYPQASSKDLRYTARVAAPFPLAQPGVP